MAAVALISAKLSGVQRDGADFSGQDLKHKKLTGSVFHNCNFDGADLSHADCTGSDFTGSSFRQSILYYTNFTRAKLAATVFEPKDAYGVTFTMECRTFENMRISQQWWYAWLLFATMMEPAREPVKGDLKSLLIAMIGAERYVKLTALFRRREF